jgi:hypothetical protein
MATTVITFKRGTTFGANCTYTQDSPAAPANLDGITLSSSILTSGANLYDLTVTKTSSTTFDFIYDGDSSKWNRGTAYLDIRFAYGAGSVFYTETVVYDIIVNITPNA